MIVQTRSQTFKKGESEDHFYAVAKVIDFLQQNKLDYRWLVDVNCHVDYPPEIIKQLPKGREHKGHDFDIGIYRPVYVDGILRNLELMAVIEINGNVGYDYIDGAGRLKHANPTKHSKALQKRNDKINKNYCELKGIDYITMLKEEINGDIRDKDLIKNTLLYMTRELVEFIK